jgi:hypothetical protein
MFSVAVNWDYRTIIDRRSLLKETTAYEWVQVTPLVPRSDYNVQVNGSNTRGFIMSNVIQLTMPPGCKLSRRNIYPLL